MALIEEAKNDGDFPHLSVNAEFIGQDHISNPNSPVFNTVMISHTEGVIIPQFKTPEFSLPRNSTLGFMETIKFFYFQNVAPTFTKAENNTTPHNLISGGRIMKSNGSKRLGSRKRHHPYNKDDGLPSPGNKLLSSDSIFEEASNLASTV
ncbi:hypothetical protein LIER_14780 [Lithospermum erythrorhizon]|uniref:Uncharacterized protein n=1 Tax=Lithospermum erythrorhizon TaxID=34254 RepID=A0AAV3Q2M4_LITER